MTKVCVFHAMLIDVETVATPRLNFKGIDLFLTSRPRTLLCLLLMNSADPLCANIRVNLDPGTSLPDSNTYALPLVELGGPLPGTKRKDPVAPGALAVDDFGGCEEGAVGLPTARDGD